MGRMIFHIEEDEPSISEPKSTSMLDNSSIEALQEKIKNLAIDSENKNKLLEALSNLAKEL